MKGPQPHRNLPSSHAISCQNLCTKQTRPSTCVILWRTPRLALRLFFNLALNDVAALISQHPGTPGRRAIVNAPTKILLESMQHLSSGQSQKACSSRISTTGLFPIRITTMLRMWRSTVAWPGPFGVAGMLLPYVRTAAINPRHYLTRRLMSD